jgi:hypothetical protein
MASKTVEQLVEEALDGFDNPEATVASHVRRAIRIASKRQDYVSLLRLYPETFDLSTGKVRHQGLEDAQANLTALVGAEESRRVQFSALMRHMQDRQQGGGQSNKVFGQSIGQLEALLAQYNEVNESYKKPPENLTPIDTYFVAKDYDSASAKLLPLRRELEDVIERVKQMVRDFLVETERQIESGQRRPHTFDRGREYIEQALRMRAPEALEKFQAAEESLEGGGPEDLAHALTSCRRMIKALADALYPATGEVITGEDGRERAMTNDAYRNRLLQFASERLGSTHNDLVKETMRSLGARLQRLTELSSKGVHDEVDRVEAETCVMWTYLTAADILRIADGTSMKKAEPAGDPIRA